MVTAGHDREDARANLAALIGLFRPTSQGWTARTSGHRLQRLAEGAGIDPPTVVTAAAADRAAGDELAAAEADRDRAREELAAANAANAALRQELDAARNGLLKRSLTGCGPTADAIRAEVDDDAKDAEIKRLREELAALRDAVTRLSAELGKRADRSAELAAANAEIARWKSVTDALQPGDSRDIAVADSYRLQRDEMAGTLRKYQVEVSRLIAERARYRDALKPLVGFLAANHLADGSLAYIAAVKALSPEGDPK